MDCNGILSSRSLRQTAHFLRSPATSLSLALLLGLSVSDRIQAQGITTDQPSSETHSGDRSNPVPAPIIPSDRDALQSATSQSNTVRPEKLDHSESLLDQIRLPEGFSISVFAEGLTNPRIIEVSNRGYIYVTEREAGQVTILQDRNRDGRVDQTIAAVSGLGEGPTGVHGLATSPQGDYMYMVTDTELYRAPILFDGRLGEPELVLENLPDAGQHPNRTIEFGPDGMLYLSIGSSTNAVAEPNPLHATLVRLDPTQTDLTVDDLEVYAEGLRNTIGFAWNPLNGQLYGWDHSSDARGDDWPPEEVNLIQEGLHYGWPFCGGDQIVDLHVTDDPEGMSKQEFCPQTETPVLNYQSHVAGMQWVYYTGNQFPGEYRNDAFVTMRGSWNRNPPVGYGILRIRHDESGTPVSAEPFATGWLLEPESAPSHFGRLTGLAQMADGSLLVANDSHGVIYRITYTGSDQASEQGSAPRQRQPRAQGFIPQRGNP